MQGVLATALHSFCRTRLQATAFVHEAFLRLVIARQDVAWQSRAHFFGIVGRLMRQVLVDHARARLAEKRGGARSGSPSTPPSPSRTLGPSSLRTARSGRASLQLPDSSVQPGRDSSHGASAGTDSGTSSTGKKMRVPFFGSTRSAASWIFP